MDSIYAVRQTPFNNELKGDLLKYIELIGDEIDFNSDVWVCNKINRQKVTEYKNYTLYFSKFPEEFKEITKFYILRRLRDRTIRIRTSTAVTGYLSIFFNFISKKYEMHDLKNINRSLLVDFEIFLRKEYTSEATRYTVYNAMKVFLEKMKDWEGIEKEYSIINPFKSEKLRCDSKYIPAAIATKLDEIFKNEKIEITVRVLYWILRMFPSRISEVIDIKRDCLKQFDDHWVLFIPMYKQNGGYIKSEIRSLHFECKGHGEYLIGIIREQQKLAKSLQNNLVESEAKEMLFAYTVSKILRKSNNEISYYVTTKSKNMNATTATRKIQKICEIYNILDEKGKPYNFATHQLRHNGVTDRYEYGFTTPLIRLTTGHKGSVMLENAYNHMHLNQPKILDKQRAVQNNKKEIQDDVSNLEVYFNGSILNMSEQMEKRLLRNYRSQRLKHGICKDITGCKNGIFECLKCDKFIPDIKEINYFTEQLEYLKNKEKIFKDSPLLLENILYNIELHEKIIKRIKMACVNEEDEKWGEFLENLK